jgi:hypothetical protein
MVAAGQRKLKSAPFQRRTGRWVLSVEQPADHLCSGDQEISLHTVCCVLWFLRPLPRAMHNGNDIDLVFEDVVDEAIRSLDYLADIDIVRLWYDAS